MSAVLKPQNPVSATKAPTVKLLINGKFVESKTQVWKDVVNPATQEVLARVPFATTEELEAAITGAHEAFKTWKHTPIGARSRVMLKLQELRMRAQVELGPKFDQREFHNVVLSNGAMPLEILEEQVMAYIQRMK